MLILKSASPRRKEILTMLGLEFSVQPTHIDETQFIGESPLDYLKRVTIAKLNSPPILETNIYVASDTIVVLDEKIYPKPETHDVATEILRELNGKTHSVFTGLGILVGGKIIYEFEETKVAFYQWTETDIQNYLKTAKPLDKAGSYGIQDEGTPVKKYEGSYSNVMGFPMRKFFLHREIWSQYWKSSQYV